MKDIEDRSRNTTPESFIEEFIDRLPEGGKVLDAGCGTGYLSQVLSEEGFDVVSVDSKEERIEEGRKKGRFQDARVTELEDADLTDGSFDGVIAVEVIEHVEEPEKFLSELTLLLKPGGVVAVKTPNKATHDLYQIVLEKNFQLLKGEELDFHPSVMTPRQLFELMEEKGFDTELLKPRNLPENQERKIGGFSKLLEPVNFRFLPYFLQPTLMAIGVKR